jgi:anti-sigma regulatory factor (Ser/Thr protein kinase)
MHFTSENFSPTLDAPRHVRALLRSQLRELHCNEDLVELGTLTASELAANAVLHAHTPFRVMIEQKGKSVWIAVEDEEPVHGRFNVVSRPLHGLALIAALAERWGVTPRKHGKVVWAELPQQATKALDHRAAPN